MKLVCMTQGYNANTELGHDGLTDIQRFMESVVKYCDGLVFFDDCSTDGTREVIGSYGDKIEIQILGNTDANKPHLEWFHRARSLIHCHQMEADWIICLKTDEVLELKSQRSIRTLLEGATTPINFRRYHLWRTDRYYRSDSWFAEDWQTRAFRLSDNLNYSERGPKTSLIPDEIADERSYSFLKILHYGFSTDRLIKSYKRRCDKLNVAYNLSEDSLHLSEAKAEWFNERQHGPDTEIFVQSI